MEDTNKIEVVRDGRRLTAYAEYERVRRNRRISMAMVIALLAVSVFMAFWNWSYNSYEEVNITQNTEGNGTKYARFIDGYLKYSKDGISYLNQKEQIRWTEAFTMDKPYVAVNEKYAAAADMDGNMVHLFYENGKIGEYSMAYPIKKIMVAKQGVFCVMLDSEAENYIRLYDTKGELLAEIKTKIENNGYPMAIALSSDASKLAASYYRVDGIDSQNIISFYNFGEGGKGQSGNLVGTYQLDNMLIPKVAFTDDNTVFVVGDSRMLVYDVKDTPKQKEEIVYPSVPLNVFSNEKYVGFTCENPVEDVEAQKAKPYEIYIYNKNGRQMKHLGMDETYESIKLIGNTIVGFTGGQCKMVRINGTEALSCNVGKNIVDILPSNYRTEFLFIYNDSSARIRLSNVVRVENKNNSVEIEE